MQPTKILIMTMSLATAFATDESHKFDEVMYGFCQAGCARRAVTCYDEAGIKLGRDHAEATPAMVRACNLGLGDCRTLCFMRAKYGYNLDECFA